MDRINGLHFIDIGGGKRGFRDEDLPTGVAGTEVTAAHMNALQEEVLKVIEAAGLNPNAADWSQLWQALKIFGVSTGSKARRWMAVISMTIGAPPGAPAEGDAYLVPAGAAGVWAANSGKIAEWTGSAWSYFTPTNGHGISLPDGRIFERVGGAYVEKLALDVQSGKWIYVEDTSNEQNFYTVAPTPAVPALVAGLGLRIKAKATNNGKSLINVAGHTDKELVRLDGAMLFDSDVVGGGVYDIVYDGTRFRLMSTVAAPQLRRPITLYVSAAGNDANDGSSPAKALRQIQTAVDRAFMFVSGAYAVTISVSGGSYERVRVPERIGPALLIVGDVNTPSNVVIDGGAVADVFSVYGPNVVSVSGVRAQMTRNASSRGGFVAYGQSTLNVDRCETGGIDGASLQAYGGGSLNVTNHRFTSSSTFMYRANVGGRIAIGGTQTLVSNIPLTTAVACADNAGSIVASTGNPVSFVNRGNLTAGARYVALLNGLINTIGGGSAFFPGETEGSVTTGGQYV